MLVNVYAIYDSLAEECGPLFTAVNDAVARRGARIALKESDPSEHELRKVGTFDTVKCELVGITPVGMSIEKGGA